MKMKKLMIILVYCGVLSSAFAQQYATIATSPAPLILKAQGSFYLGGELESQTRMNWAAFVHRDTSLLTKCTSGT